MPNPLVSGDGITGTPRLATFLDATGFTLVTFGLPAQAAPRAATLGAIPGKAEDFTTCFTVDGLRCLCVVSGGDARTGTLPDASGQVAAGFGFPSDGTWVDAHPFTSSI